MFAGTGRGFVWVGGAFLEVGEAEMFKEDQNIQDSWVKELGAVEDTRKAREVTERGNCAERDSRGGRQSFCGLRGGTRRADGIVEDLIVGGWRLLVIEKRAVSFVIKGSMVSEEAFAIAGQVAM